MHIDRQPVTKRISAKSRRSKETHGGVGRQPPRHEAQFEHGLVHSDRIVKVDEIIEVDVGVLPYFTKRSIHRLLFPLLFFSIELNRVSGGKNQPEIVLLQSRSLDAGRNAPEASEPRLAAHLSVVLEIVGRVAVALASAEGHRKVIVEQPVKASALDAEVLSTFIIL